MNIKRIKKELNTVNGSRKIRILSLEEILLEVEYEIKKLKCKKKYYKYITISNTQTAPVRYKNIMKYTKYTATLKKDGTIKDIVVEESFAKTVPYGGNYYTEVSMDKEALNSISDTQKEKLLLGSILNGH